MNTLTLDDVVCYAVLSNGYRAYIKNDANLQAWGSTKQKAISNLAVLLGEKDVAFDFSDPYGYYE